MAAPSMGWRKPEAPQAKGAATKMRSEWKRSTKECSLDQLRPELATAIREYMQEHELAGWEDTVQICCETVSERAKVDLLSRLLGSTQKVVYSAALITPRWLIYAVSDANKGASALAMQLADAEISHQLAELTQDHGPNLLAFRLGNSMRESLFIGLGEGSAADQFESMLRAVVQQAR